MTRLSRVSGLGNIATVVFLVAALFSGHGQVSVKFSSRTDNATTTSATLLQSSFVNVHFIDVGWGDAVFIDTSGKDVLIDGGYSQAGPIVLEYLTNLGIRRVDLMVATHPHPDHYGGLVTILDSPIEVDQVLFNNESYPYNFLQLAQSHNLNVAYRGQVFALADDVALQVLNPVQPLQRPPADWSGHYNNIVLKLQAGNVSFLFTGDANALAEQSMIDAGMDLRSDVLKVAIHGCGERTWENVTSQGFLDRVNPSYAVISCDYSNGAGVIVPDPLVAARLLANNITTYTTYQMGTVIAYTDGTSITFSDNSRYQYAVELKGHTRAVCSVAWSPDETLLASGSKDGTVRLWNTTTWKVVRTIDAHASGVWSVGWSPDGTTLATGGVENTVRLWNPQTGEQLTVFNTSSNVFSVSWSPEGGRLSAGLSDGNVYVLDVETGETVNVLSGNSNVVVSTAWASDGNRLASGSIDGSVRVWDSHSGSTLFTLHANTTARNDINGLAWSHDDTILAAAGQDGNVRLWDTSLATEMQVASHHEPGWSRGVSWSPNDMFLATTGQDYFVRLLCPKISRISVALPGHLSPVWSVAWSPSGKLLASGSGRNDMVGGDTRVLVWNASEIKDGIVVVPDDCTTIQEAVNDASDGDTVFVKAGTYSEHIVVNKTISLIGENRDTTIIDGGYVGVVVNITRKYVNISDFTIRRSGTPWNVGGPPYAAGIYMMNVTNCTIFRNTFTQDAVGIQMEFGADSNIIANNTITSVTLGVGTFEASWNSFTGNNVSSDGRGVGLNVNSDYNIISGNRITAPEWVLALHLCHYNNITESYIANGQIGVYLPDSSYNRVYHNQIVNNVQQASVAGFPSQVNYWDDGYPSGGNYWGGFVSPDLYSGEQQNIPGGDGIGDTPYVLPPSSRAHISDRYPLMLVGVSNVSQTPPVGSVLPTDAVVISANVRHIYPLKVVIINYTCTNSSGTWTAIVNMTNLKDDIWNGVIPPSPAGTNITYEIVTHDKIGNSISSESQGYTFEYPVVPEFPTTAILPMLLLASLLPVLLGRRKLAAR